MRSWLETDFLGRVLEVHGLEAVMDAEEAVMEVEDVVACLERVILFCLNTLFRMPAGALSCNSCGVNYCNFYYNC